MTATRANTYAIWPLGVFAATVGFLAVPMVIGSTGARIAAASAAVGMVGALWVGVRATRNEHLDDPTMPTFVELARESTAKAGRVFVYVAGYMLLGFLVALAPGSGPRRESGSAGIAVAMVASLLIIATLVDAARLQRRSGGVEREVFLQSTSYAFFATVCGAVAYALFEVFSHAPKLSMWLVWTFGMAAWGISAAVLTRRAG